MVVARSSTASRTGVRFSPAPLTTYVDQTTGKRRTASGRTKAEAAARRDAKLEEFHRATPTGRLGENPTVSAATWWVENVASVIVRPTTLRFYRKDVARITTELGEQPISTLDVEAVRSMVARLRKAGRKTGTIATLRRGCTYEGKEVGCRLDDLKTSATHGTHHLSPTAVAMLRARREAQTVERLAAGDAWPTIVYEAQRIDMVFTTARGQLVKRQSIQQALQYACERAGIDTTGVGTHTGRRSTITALFVDGVSIDDIARHVGHADSATTAGYVQDLGTRPVEVAKRAASLLDPAASQ